MNERLSRLWATKTKNDEWWSSFVTSPLAILANYFVVDIKWLTPNLITLFSFVVAIISAIFIVMGGDINFIVAAILIHLSHVLDCMDGQMARYCGTSSRSGSYFDKATDQIQVILWFGAVGYAAYLQTQNILSVFLAFAGVVFYSLRGYVKYVTIYTEMSEDKDYLEKKLEKLIAKEDKKKITAGLGYGFLANFKWLLGEQRKIFSFNEGVFIFMLSVALIFKVFLPMLWVFATSQVFYGIYRTCQRGYQLHRNHSVCLMDISDK